MMAFDMAWAVVKDREGLTPEERALPGGDAFVGPRDRGGATHSTEGYFPSYEDRTPRGRVIQGLDEALAHAEDKERERILARGIKEPRRPKIRPVKSKRPDFEEYAREFAGND
jgi:hypothetical protein